MVEIVSKILDKISTYEILTNIIPGAIFVVLVNSMTSFNLKTNEVWSDLIMIYFIGVIIGRVGSTVIESVVRKKISFAPYKEYVKAETKDTRVKELSMVNNMYRTYLSLTVCFLITIAFDGLWGLISTWPPSRVICILIFGFVMIILFQKSYRKQTEYVINRVTSVNAIAAEEKKEKDDQRENK